MLTHDQSAQLDQFEKALDEEYRNKKEAIRFMRQFLSGSVRPSLNGSLLSGITVASQDPKGLTESNPNLPPLDVNDGPTLIGKVEEVMEQYSGEKWTMRRMLAYLQQQEFPIRNAKPEASVSAALSKLARSGRITAIRPGAGKSQGIYQWNLSYTGAPVEDDSSDEMEEESTTV